ncbi:MAG TPA: hypothetical protein PKE40_07915 [Arachnia sp.]|nr:hypothetical protein [Arachnia sp.]HMT86261.1 hypothetical protein [Arachnia sp.]
MTALSRRTFLAAAGVTAGIAATADFIWSATAAHAAPPEAVSPVLDRVVFGDSASETAHHLTATLSQTVPPSTGALGQTGRLFTPTTPQSYWGGGASFTVQISPDQTNYVSVKLWGGDFDPVDGNQWRLHLYAADGTEVKQIGYQEQGVLDSLDILGDQPRSPGRFFLHSVPLPESLTSGKDEIQLEIRATGRIYSYGGTPEVYFQNLKLNSRPVYAIYTHTAPFFVPGADDVFGAAPAPASRPSGETATAEGKVRTRVQNDLQNLVVTGDPTGFDGWQTQELVESYLWNDPQGNNPGYASEAAFGRVFRAIDGRYNVWKASPTVLTASDQQWQGFGRFALALYLLGESRHAAVEAALAQPIAGTTATIVNPGFEDGGATPLGWSKAGWLGGQGDIARDTASARPGSAGTSSLSVTNTGATQVTIVDNSTAMPVVAGDTYYLSSWVKTSGTGTAADRGAALNVIFYDASGAIVPIGGVNDHRAWGLKRSATEDWNLASIVLTAPANATSLRTSVRLWGPGTAWFDDVFYANITGGRMLVNPGFEAGSAATGWSTAGWIPDQAPLVVDAANARPNSSGTRSLLIENTSASQTTIAMGSSVAIEPGQDVTVGVWIKTDKLAANTTNGVALNVLLYDASNNIVPVGGVNDQRAWATTAGWSFVSLAIVTPATAVRVDVSLRSWGEGQAWFDDVAVIPARVDLPVEGTPTRRVAYGDMLVAHWDHWRKDFPHYSNQVQICAIGLYQVARALQLYFPDRIAEAHVNGADIESEARGYVEEALGLRPWLGKLEDDWVTRRAYLGNAYRQVTEAGLTREVGYVGSYGEVTDWLVMLWEAIARGESTIEAGDPWPATIRERLLVLIKARMRFRVIDVDRDGYRVAQEQSVVGWRNEIFPGKPCYVQPTVWDGNPLQAVTVIGAQDAELVGVTRELFADGQLASALALLHQNSWTRVGLNAFRFVAHHRPAWDGIDAAAGSTPNPALPTAWGRPDFVYGDPENGLVAVKHGEEVLFASTYYRARQAINSYGRVHLLRPDSQRSATVRIATQSRPYVKPAGFDGPLSNKMDGPTFTLPDLLNFDYAINDRGAPATPGLFPLPADPLGRRLDGNVLAGTVLPRARLAADVLDPTLGLSDRHAIETVLIGRPELAVLRYGRYIVIVNSTQSTDNDPNGGLAYSTQLPGTGKATVLYWGGPSSPGTQTSTVVAGARVTLGSSITVDPLTVIVLYADEEAEVGAEVATTTRLVVSKVVVVVTVKNTSAEAAAIAISTVYGSKTFASVAPGASVSAAFTTRLATIPPGTATVVVSNGSGSATVEADYA